MEVEVIYQQTLAQGVRSLAITSCNPGEGVSTLAIALAQRSLLAGNSTLLVDLNLYHPSLRSLSFGDSSAVSSSPQLVGTAGRSLALTGVMAPVRREDILRLRRPQVLRAQIESWHSQFDTVICDTTPFSRRNANNIPAEQVAGACDGSLLVVLAGHTNHNMVSAAISKLSANDAALLGCILNDQFNPPLRQELLREVDRLPAFMHRPANAIRRWLRQNSLLSLEI
jgi:Mrp family chromosome partitioning ATPase